MLFQCDVDMTSNLWENIFPGKEMTKVAQALLELAGDDAVRLELPDIGQYVAHLMESLEMKDPSAAEAAVIMLYLALHGAGSAYSSPERERLRLKGGYSCISGGLSPLMMAGKFIVPGSVVADLGAGNGLQGLLLQRLYPHRRTMQIELSSEMIRIGRIFQKALRIGDDRMEWINDDIADVSLEPVDFIYLYRPARPSGSGNDLYRTIALKLAASQKPLVIFSVADCLSGFLDKRFSVFYTDGHLTCYSKE